MPTPPSNPSPRLPLSASLLAATLALASAFLIARADDDLNDIAAKPAQTAPAEVTDPATQPVPDALGTLKEKIPEGARIGLVTLNNGAKIEGRIWTTLETPFRIWVEDLKAYRDVDLALVQRIDVKVLSETMDDDWRWLKEGSDQKIFSGKKYPNVDLEYQFTLANGQTIQGAVVAPIYTFDGQKNRTLALYKKYKGKLDETLKDVVYINRITLQPSAAVTAQNEKLTRKLPLLY